MATSSLSELLAKLKKRFTQWSDLIDDGKDFLAKWKKTLAAAKKKNLKNLTAAEKKKLLSDWKELLDDGKALIKKWKATLEKIKKAESKTKVSKKPALGTESSTVKKISKSKKTSSKK